MKHIAKMLLTAACIASSLFAGAQQTTAKSQLFKNYPAAVSFSETQLQQLFTLDKGSKTSLRLQGNLLLEGTLVKRTTAPALETIAFRLPAFNNILFSLSRRMDEKNMPVYIGHLFSADYADGYQLRKTANGYELQKVDMEKLLPVCSH